MPPAPGSILPCMTLSPFERSLQLRRRPIPMRSQQLPQMREPLPPTLQFCQVRITHDLFR